jgi:hypothetical protein
MKKVIREFATPEQVAECLIELSKMFPNSDMFYTILAEYVFDQQITVRELKNEVVKYLVENHRGNLYAADVLELCRSAKRNRHSDKGYIRMHENGLSLPEGITVVDDETFPDAQKVGEF